MRIPITSDLVALLRENGVECFLHPGMTDIAKDVNMEPPCSLKWLAIEHRLELGSFSYAVSGFCSNAVIGRYCSIGENVQIGRGDHPTSWLSTSPAFYLGEPLFNVGTGFPDAIAFSEFRPVLPKSALSSRFRQTNIGNDVWIGHGAFIRQGVQIGDGAVIGAHAVVVKDVPPYAVVAGNPATVKKFRLPEKTIERVQASRWWRFAPWQIRGIDFTDVERAIDEISSLTIHQAPYAPSIVTISQLLTFLESR